MLTSVRATGHRCGLEVASLERPAMHEPPVALVIHGGPSGDDYGPFRSSAGPAAHNARTPILAARHELICPSGFFQEIPLPYSSFNRRILERSTPFMAPMNQSVCMTQLLPLSCITGTEYSIR